MPILCKINFSMDSVINSFTARLANTPSHKSVGKNGTFWLPPESTNSFSSKLKDFSSRKLNPSGTSLKNNSAETKGQLKSDGKIHASSNTRKPTSLNLETKVSNNRILKSTNPTLIAKNSGMNERVDGRSNLANRVLQGESLPVNKNVLNRGIEKKYPENENLLKDKVNHSLIGDKEEHEGQKNNQNHGTKNAYFCQLMIATEKLNLILTQAASIAKSEKRLHDNSCKLLEYLAREITAKIACLNKGESTIVRIAFDLPNGSAMSVRLEQTSSHLSISFITQDTETQDVIEFIQELLGRGENYDASGAVSVNLFKSYQDMDNFFQQAA